MYSRLHYQQESMTTPMLVNTTLKKLLLQTKKQLSRQKYSRKREQQHILFANVFFDCLSNAIFLCPCVFCQKSIAKINTRALYDKIPPHSIEDPRHFFGVLKIFLIGSSRSAGVESVYDQYRSWLCKNPRRVESNI